MKSKPVRRLQRPASNLFTGLAWLCWCCLPAVTRAGTNLQVGVAPPSSANEFNSTAFLTWTAAASGTYLVQSSTNLGNPAAWTTEDAVSQGTIGPLKWMAPEALEVQKYYRIIPPQPRVFSVEPAVIAPGMPVDFYLLGQSFPSNAVLQINGVTQTGTVFQNSSTLVQPAFVPAAAGNYQFSLLVGGVVASSFTVVCADPVANPELVLQGPPDAPPAGPSCSWLSKKGFDYYRSRSDLTAARASVAGGQTDGSLLGSDYVSAATKSVSLSLNGGPRAAGRAAGQPSLGATFTFTPYSLWGAGGGPAVGDDYSTLLMLALLRARDIAIGTEGGGPNAGGELATLFMPALMKAKEKANRTKCGVRLYSGEVQAQAADLVIPGVGLDFAWARTYHSRIGRFGAATNGWTFSYDVRCVQNSTGGMDVYDGTGRKDTFMAGTNGIYTCPEMFREGAVSNNAFTLTFADTGRWIFNPFDGTATAGKLSLVVDRNGNTIALVYDSFGRLAQIVDDLGRTNTVAYNSAGLVASLTDFSGRSVTYQYYSGAKSDNGSAGDLKSVTSPPVTGTPNGNDFPSGKTTTYTYSKSFPLDRENHLLLTVTDAAGQTAAVFTYEHNSIATNYLRCIAAQEGTNLPSCFNWVLVARPAGSYAVSKCLVNDPVGNVSEYFFDARNRCVLEDDYTGRATPGLPVSDTANQPTGPLRATDPAYYETRWNWNNDSLCTSETSPGSQQMQCVYQSDFDPATTARKRADCRVVREIAASPVDLNGDGIPDVTARAAYYTYDSRFGSEPAASRGWDGTIKGKAIGTKGTGSVFRKAGSPPATSFAGGEDESPKEELTWDGTIKGLATEARRAISTRGTGSIFRGRHGTLKGLSIDGGEENPKESLGLRSARGGGDRPTESLGLARRGWDGTIKGLYFGGGEENPTESLDLAFNAMAIKTKGTGADNNRTATDGGAWRFSPTDFIPEDQMLFLDPRAYDCGGFVTSATDPRGNVTTGGYDPRGNLLFRIRKRPEILFTDWQEGLAYDARGQLTTITNAADASGRSRVDTLSWSQGQITNCMLDAGGLALTSAFQYDARGNLTHYIDPRTNDWLQTYNSLDQLVQSSSATISLCFCKIEMRYAYDANDNLVQCATDVLDPTGNSQGTRTDNFQYDGADRLAQIALAVDASHALTNRFAYDGNDECIRVLGGDAVSGANPNQTRTYDYDERGLLFHASAAPGSALADTNGFDYDANGGLAVLHRGGAGGTAYFAPDGFGRLATAIDPMGNQSVCFYDANDNLKVLRELGELNDLPGSAGNLRLAESDYQYDGLDRCAVAQDLLFDPATQSPLGAGQAVTTAAYTPNDECVSITDALGHTTTYGYDTAGRPLSVTDALGNQRSVVYDAGGNPLVEMSSELPAAGGKPQVLAVTNVYDNLDRCVSTTDSAGNASSYAYDSLGHCVQTTDPRGTLSFYSYDWLDRCTLAVSDLDQDGALDFTGDITTTYAWSSSSGDLLAVTDSNTNTTSYAYDALGRCIDITRADGTQEQMSWDPRGNLAWQQDANGTTLTNTYDLCDRLVHRDIAARNVLATTTFETYAYDGCGRVVGATNDAGGNAFSYDSLADCVSETFNGLTTASTYDAGGNRLSLTYPGGRVLTFTYDTLNRCASVTDSGQQLASYRYDGPARLSQINYGNGTRTQIAYDGFAGTPNGTGDSGFGQIRRMRHVSAASGTVIEDRTFGYDPDQNKTLRDVTAPLTIGGVAEDQTFQYDSADRLVAALVTTNGALTRLTAYGLDRMGNRTNVTGEACSGAYTLSSVSPPADYQMNRYTTTPCDARAYDSDGNLVTVTSTAGPVSYQYDFADRLVAVQTVSYGTGVPVTVPVASYAYDALGRRVAKTVYASGLPPTATQFLYDGSEVIEERTGSATTATYVYCDRVQNGTETDLEGVCLTLRRGGQDYYLHTDDQGNTLAVSTTSGAVVERYDYDDYGAVTFLTSEGYPSSATASAVGNVYLWGGLRFEAETGLQTDDGGGYFEPQTGRKLKYTPRVPVLSVNLRWGLGGNNPWSPAGTLYAKSKDLTGHVTLIR